MSINSAWDAKVFNEIKSGKRDSKVNNKKSPTGISEKGIEFLKQYESFEPQAYLLEGEDYYTIGYGHQIYEGGTSVVINGETYDTLTEELATTLFMDDINSTFAPCLNKFLSDNQIVLNQNQYDALIADSFQKGPYIWEMEDDYSIVSYIKAGDFSNKEEGLKAFIGDPEGIYKEGLINRRTAEANMFFGD
jgi:GH24 family phage-related lysozyme (muramidase)